MRLFFSLNYIFNQNNFIMKNKMKAFGLSLGVFVMSFTFFVGNPSYVQAEEEEEKDWICCAADSSGCTDALGCYWGYDEKREGVPTCTIY